jgi:hypothetical protein
MASLQRIVRGRSATLTHTFYSDATATDPSPDTTTVTLPRADGTAVVTGAAATEAGTGVVTYTVTPAQTALLDRWTVTWTATFGGQSQPFVSYVEVAGDVLFSLAEARAVAPLNNTTTYTTAAIVAMRTSVEQAIEDEYGTALVPRYERETVRGDGSGTVRLRAPGPTIRSATTTASGVVTTLTAGDLALLSGDSGFVTGYGWPTGLGNITVGYEYGLDRPPQRIKMDALRLCRQWLVNGPVDDRALGVAAPDGAFSFGLATPGRNGSIFGLPDLDAAIQASPYRALVA